MKRLIFWSWMDWRREFTTWSVFNFTQETSGHFQPNNFTQELLTTPPQKPYQNKKMKKCELCNSLAKMHCESDHASLYWDCDAKVHATHFLIARHSRTLLCHLYQSFTLWRRSTPRRLPMRAGQGEARRIGIEGKGLLMNRKKKENLDSFIFYEQLGILLIGDGGDGAEVVCCVWWIRQKNGAHIASIIHI